MIALDTNVLVRYLTQDDPAQFRKAAREIDAAVRRGERLLICPVVLCELVWVLTRGYGYSRPDVAGVLHELLSTAQFEFSEQDAVSSAADDYARGNGDFADYLIGRLNLRSGARSTLTFDRALDGARGFTLLA